MDGTMKDPRPTIALRHRRASGRKRASAALTIAALLAAPGAAHAVIVTREHGIDFVTVGDPGNRPVNAQEGPEFFDPNIWPQPTLVGSVGYEYRMSRTEITVAQWHEFVQAYAPYYTGSPNASAFTGQHIFPSGVGPGGIQRYSIVPGAEQFPTNMSWRFAARYCNWLHNGRANKPEAFESGAYDTSTFTQNGQGWYNDQERRSEGARFWIPSMDEWVKGMHWDPSKNNGEGGYWYYPTSSDEMPVSGLPGTPGAQTATGLQAPPFWQAVGLYPDVQSPWGLLDGTGGESEWLEEVSQGPQRLRLADGSRMFSMVSSWDRLDRTTVGLPSLAGFGLRVASFVPCTSSPLPMAILFSMFGARRRRP